MGQGYFGSICIDDLFTGKIAKGSNGKHYICVEDLNALPFNKSAKNGKTYAGIGIWINDEVDEFQNIAGITLSQTLEQREAKEKKQYIGNLKFAQAKGTAASPGGKNTAGTPLNAPVDLPAGDLPF